MLAGVHCMRYNGCSG